MKRIGCTLFLLLLLVVPTVAQNHESLPETFVSDDERLTMRYPSGWVVQNPSQGQVLVGTSSDTLMMSSSDLPSGEAGMILLFLTANQAFVDAEIFVSGDPVASLSGFMNTITAGANEDVAFSPPEATTFGVNPAARADGHVNNNDAFIVLVEYDDTLAIIVGLVAGGEMGKYEPKLLAIAESVNYAPE
jgi:hypothetical protein